MQNNDNGNDNCNDNNNTRIINPTQDDEAGKKMAWKIHCRWTIDREVDEEEESERIKQQQLRDRQKGGIFSRVVADGLADQYLTEGLISPEILNNHSQYVADRMKRIAHEVAETGRRGSN